MKLTDLDAKLMVYHEEDVPVDPGHPTGKQVTWSPAPNLGAAHGLIFLCPRCMAGNGGPVGTHSVITWFQGAVPDHAQPGPGRWAHAGNGLEDLTLAPSIQLIGGCEWHGFVKDGDAA